MRLTWFVFWFSFASNPFLSLRNVIRYRNLKKVTENALREQVVASGATSNAKVKFVDQSNNLVRNV